MSSAPRITGSEREALIEDLTRRYRAGATVRELAASTGRSYGFVHQALQDSGVPMRSRGGDTRSPRP